MTGIKYAETQKMICRHCKCPMQPAIYKEKEYNKNKIPTGRIKFAVEYLFCPICGETSCVDDSFDGDWFTPSTNDKGAYKL